MMYFPKDSDLYNHVDHYWIVTDVNRLFQDDPQVRAYPGLTPEIIIPLKGYYSITYLGKTKHVSDARVYAFIKDTVVIDFTNLESFVIVQFKTRGISSIQPFIDRKATDIMGLCVSDGSDFFGKRLNHLTNYLRSVNPDMIPDVLDDWLMNLYNGNDGGFIAELMLELEDYSSLQEIMNQTKYSYSTLQRHFKRDTGLAPKKYQTFWRAKKTIEEIYNSQNTDWMYYVSKYGYFDQKYTMDFQT